jgi:hypothetical protein
LTQTVRGEYKNTPGESKENYEGANPLSLKLLLCSIVLLHKAGAFYESFRFAKRGTFLLIFREKSI